MPWARLHDQANGNGKLLAIGDAAFRLWACGLIYCQANLTDGFIPDTATSSFGVRASRADTRRAIEELCTAHLPGKSALWMRVAGGYQVHDYLEWNTSREEVLRDRDRTRDRVTRFRTRLAAIGNGGETALQRQFETGNTERAERSVKSGSTTTEDQDQDQRRSRAAPLNNDNPNVLTKLAHTVLDMVDRGDVAPADLSEELKRHAARAGLRYDGDRVRKSLDSAEAQRRRA